MERSAHSSSPFASKEQESLSRSTTFENKILNPSQIYYDESKHNMMDISLSNVPLPPNPNLLAQGKENDNLETFNLKKVDPAPIEALCMARPHLASPMEFLSHSKGQDTGLSNGKMTD